MNRLIDAAITLGFIGLLLAGCGTFSPKPDPSKFFTLSSAPQVEEAAVKDPSNSERIFLGIGPIKFPGYLDRQEIVTRSAENRFDVSENDRWAEPLDENFARVLSQNLAVLLPTGRIIQYPWPNSKKPNYQVEIEVLRFEVDSTRDAQLWARWEVIDASNKTPVTVKESRLQRQAKDRTTDAAVAALSEAGADLSREIAEAVRAITGRKTAMSGTSVE
jgi:uncharacterized lipoprotein YmbA